MIDERRLAELRNKQAFPFLEELNQTIERLWKVARAAQNLVKASEEANELFAIKPTSHQTILKESLEDLGLK